jgi:hypothetical protein
MCHPFVKCAFRNFAAPATGLVDQSFTNFRTQSSSQSGIKFRNQCWLTRSQGAFWALFLTNRFWCSSHVQKMQSLYAQHGPRSSGILPIVGPIAVSCACEPLGTPLPRLPRIFFLGLLPDFFHFELERRRFSLATAIGCIFLPEASRCFFNSEIGLPRRLRGQLLERLGAGHVGKRFCFCSGHLSSAWRTDRAQIGRN